MQKIQYSIYQRETGNASGKAKKDCLSTLGKIGFKHLYNPSSNRTVRVIQQIVALIKLSVQKKEKIFIIQYPAIHAHLYNLVGKTLHKNDISIVVIHDILSLQYENIEQGLCDEIDFLNKFKYVIVPNSSMKNLLYKNGLESYIVDMKIYDYLHNDEREVINGEFFKSICFAGNLTKSTFLKELNRIPSRNFVLYGANGESLETENVKYKGCLPADELIYFMEGDYGLVWDGTSIGECAGTVGRYLLYNSPHKLSSYISAGKPVITWRKAAIAKFVVDNNIGIVVDSLEELTDIDLANNYNEYRSNVLKIKKRIANGDYLRTAIEKIYKLEGIAQS